MASELLSASVATIFLFIVSLFILRRLRPSHTLQDASKAENMSPESSSIESTVLSRNLASALSDCVIFPHNAAAFKQSMNSYWAQQECEVMPACVVQPRNIQQLCTAVTILKRENDERDKKASKGTVQGLFAIRSGGHSPLPGSASIKGGIMIDLSLFCEVIPSEDGSSVVIGAGAKWMDVSKVLDEKGLAVVGGRNSAVGVGGLSLGGRLVLLTSVLSHSPCFHCEPNLCDFLSAAPPFIYPRTNVK